MTIRRTFLFTAAWLVTSCTAPLDDDAVAVATGEANAAPVCRVFSAQLGRTMTADELAALGDPAARRLLAGGPDCPQKLDAIMATLRSTASCAAARIRSTVVSERAFLLDRPEASRAVIHEDCGDGTNEDLFVSVFGMHGAAATLPQNGTEIIGYDAKARVFNYYVNEGGWKYMGSSRDAVTAGYTCGPNGDCLSNAASKARCFACHESGGLNMKELNLPWSGWSPRGVHADALFERFGAQLGTEEDAERLEIHVERANTRWNEHRIEILRDLGAEELLRPLFCTVTFNLQAAGVRGRMTELPKDLLLEVPKAGGLEPAFAGIGFSPGHVSTDATTYSNAVVTSGQRMVDASGRTLRAPDGAPIVEPPRPFVYPTNGDIDRRYVSELVRRRLIDQDFALDVLSVDVSRPVFSPDRCALLGAAPRLAGAAITPASVREGFKVNLAQRTDPAARELLAHLSDPQDRSKHWIKTSRFLDACRARPREAFAADVLRYNAHLKSAAKAHEIRTPDGVQGIIEFAETLPVDDLATSPVSFDPTTCTLR